MYNCSKIQKNLSAYIDNELSDEEKLKVDKHLSICLKCRKEFELLKEISKIISIKVDKVKETCRAPDYIYYSIKQKIKRENNIIVWLNEMIDSIAEYLRPHLQVAKTAVAFLVMLLMEWLIPSVVGGGL